MTTNLKLAQLRQTKNKHLTQIHYLRSDDAKNNMDEGERRQQLSQAQIDYTRINSELGDELRKCCSKR